MDNKIVLISKMFLSLIHQNNVKFANAAYDDEVTEQIFRGGNQCKILVQTYLLLFLLFKKNSLNWTGIFDLWIFDWQTAGPK